VKPIERKITVSLSCKGLSFVKPKPPC